MQQDNLIPADDFCIKHNVEISFIHSLYDYGLIEMVTVNQQTCIPLDSLKNVEKFIHLHELDINTEGIDAIAQLLNRVENLQDEINGLKNRLRFYEEG
ncbi:MAG TPA: chaperone modulator CbpM [Chitinophagaceae bacterium]|nr:chaperone modulator CbpM [Chitinophagaceae bacterium]